MVIDLDLGLVDGHVLLVPEDGRDLLERETPRVGPEEPHADATEGAGDDEREVELPADVPRGGGVLLFCCRCCCCVMSLSLRLREDEDEDEDKKRE